MGTLYTGDVTYTFGREGLVMKRGLLLSALVASVTSAAVTALVMLVLLPVSVHGQAARTTATGITVVNSDGLQGITGDVRPTGGGLLRIFGADGTTDRVSLSAAGANPQNAGLDAFDASGNLIAHIGTFTLGNPSALGNPGAFFRDAQGNIRFLASLDANGNGSIKLLDASGNVIWSAP